MSYVYLLDNGDRENFHVNYVVVSESEIDWESVKRQIASHLNKHYPFDKEVSEELLLGILSFLGIKIVEYKYVTVVPYKKMYRHEITRSFIPIPIEETVWKMSEGDF